MKFILKMHSEITIKSNSVRRRFNKLLASNVRVILKNQGFQVRVHNFWDRLDVYINYEAEPDIEQAIASMQRIPGINSILQVQESKFTDLDDIYHQVKQVWQHKLAGKTFAVRVKRKGKHDFTSPEIAAHVGGGLNQFCDTGGVNLKHPDIAIQIQVENDTLLLIDQRLKGLGGMPLPTQGDVLSLISGGFDSGVATYDMIRRGARTHYCFFNLGGRDHEIGVRAVSNYIWNRYSSSHRVKFFAVDFAPVVDEILEKVDNGLMGVVLKRMMLRAADMIASNLAINTLVTGEAMGQVSSQTLDNLHVIDESTSKLVLRPLICKDKMEIIDTARQIGTEDFAKTMPEYCGVISQKPTVKAKLDKVREEEAKFDISILERAVVTADAEDIRSIVEKYESQGDTIETVSELKPGDTLLDIRAPEEEELNPLNMPGIDIQHLPFFKLASQFSRLDQSKTYHIYCDRGVMSLLQAQLLMEHGHHNVKVYRP